MTNIFYPIWYLMRKLFFILLLAPMFTQGQIITKVAGIDSVGYNGDGGPAVDAKLKYIDDVFEDRAGNIYIADAGNNRIRKINPAGIITTIAGNGIAGYSGDGGPADSAELNYPFGVFVDTLFNIYIADEENNRIRKIDAATGIINTIAGNGTAGFSGDSALATHASLDEPTSVFLDTGGNIIIADYNNKRIRKVDVISNIITTIVGNGTLGYFTDSTLANETPLCCM